MIKNILTENPKLIYVATALISALLVVVPLRSTWTLWKESNDLGDQIARAQAFPDAGISDRTALPDEVDFERKVFDVVAASTQSHHVIVKQLETPKEAIVDHVIEQSQQVVLAGGFVDILKSLDEIAGELAPVKFASISFDRVERNKEVSLEAKIVFQCVKLEKE